MVVDQMSKKENHQTPWDQDELQDSLAGEECAALPSQGQRAEDESEDNLTLAHLSKTSKPVSPLTMDKQNKTVEHQYNHSNTKRKHHLDPTTKQAVYGQTQNFAGSVSGGIDGASSRGKAKSSAVIRAEEVRSNLEPEFPSFVKSLVRSHVASCFCMGLPGLFCKTHLPDKDTTITLEDESGQEYKLKYIAYKTGLSAGWRQFSVVHKLQEGDVLVFQLVEPTKFKVYIIRTNDLSELDGALSLLNLDSFTKKEGDKVNAYSDAEASISSKRKPDKSVSVVVPKKKKTSVSRLTPKVRQSAQQSGNDSEEVRSQVLEGFKRIPEFKDVKGFENFSIIINGVEIDAELPKEVRSKYYKLCCSEQAFLHDNLIKDIDYKLIVGIIWEIVNIADAIKVSTLSSSRAEFAKWDKTLLAFEHLGMNVEFLRLRIRRLVSITYETVASENRRCSKSRSERNQADEEVKNIETKLEELKEACNGFGAYLESLKYKSENYRLKFQEEVTAPW